MRKYTFIIGIMITLTVNICVAGPDADSMALDSSQSARLDRAANLLDSVPTPDDIQWLEKQLTPGNEPVNMLAAAILYKSDTAAYGDALFEYYSIHDYEAQAQGQKNFIAQNDLVATVEKIEEQVAETFVKRNLMHLFGFWYYRDRNEWLEIKDQMISAARFFRLSSLAAYIGLDRQQAMDLAARIDQSAKEMTGTGE